MQPGLNMPLPRLRAGTAMDIPRRQWKGAGKPEELPSGILASMAP